MTLFPLEPSADHYFEYTSESYSSYHLEESPHDVALNWTFVRITPFLPKKSSQEFNFHMKPGLKGISIRAGVNY